MELKNKVVIVTGASQGIGLATAKVLSRLGAKVIIAARSAHIIKNLEKELPDSLAIPTDMRNPKDIHHLITKTIEKYGRIDILINNAGQGVYGPVETIDVEHFRQIMELNVYSIILAMQEVIPQMRKQKGGMIINISSQVTKRYIPGISAYSATKYALNAISLIARQELERDNIIVSIVEPKMTATNFIDNAIGSRPAWTSSRGQSLNQLPAIDSAEKVAGVIAEAIASEKADVLVE